MGLYVWVYLYASESALHAYSVQISVFVCINVCPCVCVVCVVCHCVCGVCVWCVYSVCVCECIHVLIGHLCQRCTYSCFDPFHFRRRPPRLDATLRRSRDAHQQYVIQQRIGRLSLRSVKSSNSLPERKQLQTARAILV